MKASEMETNPSQRAKILEKIGQLKKENEELKKENERIKSDLETVNKVEKQLYEALDDAYVILKQAKKKEKKKLINQIARGESTEKIQKKLVDYLDIREVSRKARAALED